MSGRSEPADLGRKETTSLIAASKVRGTDVYDAQGNSLGSIHDVMLKKREGQVAYAVLSFGGFLGLRNKYHALPWDKLKYSEDDGGYIVNVDRAALEGAPGYGEEDAPDWSTPAYGQRVDDYYARMTNVI